MPFLLRKKDFFKGIFGDRWFQKCKRRLQKSLDNVNEKKENQKLKMLGIQNLETHLLTMKNWKQLEII